MSDITAEEAAKAAAERKQIEADLQEDVNTAVAKHDAALAELPGGSVAERAWNATKADDDPVYREISSVKKQQLAEVEEAVRRTGNADVVGLEAYEAEVKRLLEAEGITPGRLVPGPVTDTLPDDFPHVDLLRAGGITTRAQVRALNGDYSSVAGVGEARGKEIDAAL